MSTQSREMDGRCSVGNRLGRTEAAKTHVPSRGHQDKQANSPAEPQKDPWTGRIRCQRSRDSERVRGREGEAADLCREQSDPPRALHTPPVSAPTGDVFLLAERDPERPQTWRQQRRGRKHGCKPGEFVIIDGEISSPLPACFPDH